MKLIHGSRLTADQRRDVLARFVHRHTHENSRQSYGGRCVLCAQRPGGNTEIIIPAGQQAAGEVRKMWHEHHIPAVSDVEWLADHAFYIRADGRLSERHRHCEPAYRAETE
jgi:hypothetical protein